MKKVLLFLALLITPKYVLADAISVNRTEEMLVSSSVGIGEILAAQAVQNSGLPTYRSWGIEGFSYMATDLGYRFLPKPFKFLSPIIVGIAASSYRLGQGNSQDISRRFACNVFGIVGSCISYNF